MDLHDVYSFKIKKDKYLFKIDTLKKEVEVLPVVLKILKNELDIFTIIKKSRSKLVLKTDAFTFPIYIKRYIPKSFLKRILGRFDIMKADREWKASSKLLKLGINTLPFFAKVKVFNSKNNFLICSFLLSKEQKYESFYKLWQKASLEEKKILLKKLVLYVRRLHSKGIYHPDLTVHHVGIINDEWGIVDIDGIKISKFPLFPTRKMANLFQLSNSLPEIEKDLLILYKKYNPFTLKILYKIIKYQKLNKRKIKKALRYAISLRKHI